MLLTVGISVAVSLVTFWGLGGFIHYWFYVRRRDDAQAWKIQSRRFLSPAMTRHAFFLGSFNMVLGSVLGGLFAWHVTNGGWSSLYFDPLAHGIPWLLASAIATYFAIDAGLYYSHRFLHREWMFKRIHRWHHRYTAPIIFTTTAVHPVEFLTFQAFVLLPAVIIPVHWAVYVAVVGYTYFIGMVDHCGVRVTWHLPLHAGNGFHDDHHVHFHCNYGHHTQIWDLLHDTVRKKERKYGPDVFGGRGAPDAPLTSAAPAIEEASRTETSIFPAPLPEATK